MRPGLLSELVTIGYEIFLEGDHVKLHYRKQDSPPDMVRPLIDELRMCKADVVKILKANTLAPAGIVESGAPVLAIWRNPYPKGTAEARQESLSQIMMAIWESTFDCVAAIWPRDIISTLEISKAELEVEKVKALVLSGKAKLADFRQAVEAWDRICLVRTNGQKH